MVIHTFFKSLVSTLQTRIAQECIPAIAITGKTSIRGRARIVAERQRGGSQDSDFTAWVVEDNKLSYVKPAPCRILIITSVGTAGINLYRANQMILIDHFFETPRDGTNSWKDGEKRPTSRMYCGSDHGPHYSRRLDVRPLRIKGTGGFDFVW